MNATVIEQHPIVIGKNPAVIGRNPAAIQPLPQIRAELLYLEPAAEKPRSLEFEPPPGVPQTTAVYRPHEVVIHDMRPVAGSLSLDREGFRLLRAPSSVSDFHDEVAVTRRYYAEAVALLQKVTGATRVVVFDHTLRRRIQGVSDRSTGFPRQPVPRIHVDYTIKSGPQRVRDFLGDEAENLLRKRFAIMNVWRPIGGPVLDSPLAVSDAGTVAPQDLIATDLVYPDRIGEIYYVAHNPDHKWYYAPAMRDDEVMLIKCYDSLEDGRARFTPHSAFLDPTTPAGAPPRQSIELRTLVFWS